MFVVFFAASVRSHIHETPGSDTLSTLSMVGPGRPLGGFMLFISIEFSLADVPNKLTHQPPRP